MPNPDLNEIRREARRAQEDVPSSGDSNRSSDVGSTNRRRTATGRDWQKIAVGAITLALIVYTLIQVDVSPNQAGQESTGGASAENVDSGAEKVRDRERSTASDKNGTTRTERSNNMRPEANLDQAQTKKGQTVVIDVLADDLDSNGDDVRIKEVENENVIASPFGYSTQITDDEKIRFMPGALADGEAEFYYKIVDPHGASDKSLVRVQVGASEAAEVETRAHETSSGKGNSSIADQGLVAYYPFNGTARDASKNSNDGLVMGDAYFVNGMKEEAINFDGRNDYVEVPDDNSLDITPSITLSAWIKPVETSREYIVHKMNSTSGGGVSYSLDIFPSPGRARGLFVNSIDPKCYSCSATGKTEIKRSSWQHIATTANRNEAKVYFNGELEDTAPLDGNGIDTTSGPLRIGQYQDMFFRGLVDEVRIYNRALSEKEVQAIYQNADR
jgi:hypothetical protein